MRKLLPLPLLLLLISCHPADLYQVAKSLDTLAISTGTAQTLIVQMEEQKLIDTDLTRTILLVFQKCNLAQKEAITITRKFLELNKGANDKVTQAQLIAIMSPVTNSVKNLVDEGVVGIKNPDTKLKVLSVIQSVQAVITTINLTLNGG
jgi:hypothetical protein